jgi:chemotaxis protein histidine kinase CheA
MGTSTGDTRDVPALGRNIHGAFMATSNGSENPDATLRELFAAEVDMHLPALSEGLMAIERGNVGNGEIESLMRAAHSIKGAARIVGLDRAVQIAHLMEDCFTAAKEHRITLGSDAVDILLQGVDALQRTCSPEPDSETGGESLQALLQRITLVREGTLAPSARESSPAPPSALATPGTTLPPDTLVFSTVIDSTAIEALRVQLCDILDRQPERIYLDFGQVEHLSVSVVSLLLSFADEARKLRSAMTIEAQRVTPSLRTLFRVLGLDSTLAVNE